MGQGNSRLKRSGVEFGSSRSVAFSIPSRWNRNTYTNSTPRQPANTDVKPKPILRNSSNVSSVENRGRLADSKFSTSTRSLHNLGANSYVSPYDNIQEDDWLANRGHSYSSSDLRSAPSTNRSRTSRKIPQMSNQDFNDVYINNDLQKFYKAQDRSHFVAHMDDNELVMYDSTMSLDRKLFLLRQQRSHSEKVPRHHPAEDEEHRPQGAIERRIRSRKAKRAPEPQPARRSSNAYNKREAPNPPLGPRSRSLTSLRHPPNVQESLLEEIQGVLRKRGEKVMIPIPDYDAHTSPERVAQESSSLPHVGHFKKKKKAPPTPNKVDLKQGPPTLPKPNLESFKPKLSTETVSIEVHTEPVLQELKVAAQASEPSYPASPLDSSPKKETKEVAIQYDAPVEIAIQCDGNTFKGGRIGFNSAMSSIRSIKSTTPSMLELLDLFNQAVKAADTSVASITSPVRQQSFDSNSLHSHTDSCASYTRIEREDGTTTKIVPMSEVLAGIPPPPPLPPNNVRLIQRTTIHENVPMTIAPSALASTLEYKTGSANDSPLPSRSMSKFSLQLREVYEKLENKRKTNPTIPNRKVELQDSSTSELSGLQAFRSSNTIMGIEIKAEQEADSGHDDMSDGSITAESVKEQSIPDFVFENIAKSYSQTNLVEDCQSKKKFHSIKRIRKSMKNLVASFSRSSGKAALKENELYVNEVETRRSRYADENWTLSGRGQKKRPSLNGFRANNGAANATTLNHQNGIANTSDEIGMVEVESPIHSLTSPNSFDKGSSLPSVNMKSLRLTSPSGLTLASTVAAAPETPAVRVDNGLGDIQL